MLRNDGASLIARNNLAMTLAAQSRNSEALAQIDAALNIAADSPLLGELLDTQSIILAAVNGASTYREIKVE